MGEGGVDQGSAGGWVGGSLVLGLVEVVLRGGWWWGWCRCWCRTMVLLVSVLLSSTLYPQTSSPINDNDNRCTS